MSSRLFQIQQPSGSKGPNPCCVPSVERAAPLAGVTMAWGAQAWAFRLALVGQVAFVVALALGLRAGGLLGGAWAVSAVMVPYFGWYFWRLARWPDVPASPPAAPGPAMGSGTP